jgi:hypothetical protein
MLYAIDQLSPENMEYLDALVNRAPLREVDEAAGPGALTAERLVYRVGIDWEPEAVDLLASWTRPLAELVTGCPLFPLPPARHVNLNVLAPGKPYPEHQDGCDAEVVVYLGQFDEEQGGRLVVEDIPITGPAGSIIAFAGKEHRHRVEPHRSSPRLSFVVGWSATAEVAADPELERALYQETAGVGGS